MAAGTVAVNFVADTKRFGKPVRGARKDVLGFNKGVKGVTKSLLGMSTQLLAVAGVGAGVGGFAAFVSSQLHALDVLSTTAEKLGITTQALEFMRFAAIKSNVGINTLELALQRMVRRVGQAARGTGEAQNALKAFNIDAKEFVKLSPDKQFSVLRRHITAIGNQGERLAIAMQFFDSEGVNLVNTMALNMGDVREEFEQLGGAASTDAVANANAFADASNNLKQALSAGGRDLVIGISQPAIKIVKELTRLAKLIIGDEQDIGTSSTTSRNVAAAASIIEGTTRASVATSTAFGLQGVLTPAQRERKVQSTVVFGFAQLIRGWSIAVKPQEELLREMRDSMLVNPNLLIQDTNQF